MKEWSEGGGEDGRERAGVEEELVCELKCSLEILSEKKVINSLAREVTGDSVGRYNLS